MNREILFKAKRKDNGEWVEGYLFDDGITKLKRYFIGGIIIEPYEGTACDEWNIVGIDFCEIDIDTLCQYTGLTDKNGKKIWENDILRRDGYWDIRIEFENGVFMVRNTDKVQYINRVVYAPISIFDIKMYEVIGNIFDNPELLEVEQ